MNYLVGAVLVLWVVNAVRKYRVRNKPTEIFPYARNIAMKELLAKAAAKEPHAVEVLATAVEECNKGI